MTAGPLDVLARIRASRPAPVPLAGERCELCGETIGERHGHIVDVETRRLMCACRGCALLFVSTGAGGGHFRAVPDRYVALPVTLSPAQWDAMQIPVGVAFMLLGSATSTVAAFYPGPAGATESLLPLDAWDELVRTNPRLSTLEPDVEALLLRLDPERGGAECFIVPIDACYELVGRLRRLWRGFDGGQEARLALADFFDGVRASAR